MSTLADSPSSASAEVTPSTILPVRRVSREGGEYIVKCPHCEVIIGIEGDDMSQIRGEQYQHRRREYPTPRGTKSVGCDGWMEVTNNASFVREL